LGEGLGVRALSPLSPLGEGLGVRVLSLIPGPSPSGRGESASGTLSPLSPLGEGLGVRVFLPSPPWERGWG